MVTNYNCAVVRGVTFNDGGWHRVTVKALDTIYASGRATPGFIVFIDGNYVYCTDETDMGIAGNLNGTAGFWNELNALFPSAHPAAADFDTITAVDFAGQGDVDELVFTRTAPFDAAKDVGVFTIGIPAAGNGVVSVTITTNGYNETINVAETASTKTFTITSDLTSHGIKIVGNYATGYMKGAWVTELIPDQDGYYYPTADGDSVGVVAKKAGAMVDGVPYETLAQAIAVANGADSDCKVTLFGGETSGIEIDNTTPGVNIVLDLAGTNITVASGAAITLTHGSLIITNSDASVVGVVSSADANSAASVSVADGAVLKLAGGQFDSPLDIVGELADSLKIVYAEPVVKLAAEWAADVVEEYNTTEGVVQDGYALTVSGDYYTLTESSSTTVNVTVNGGANATPAWTVNGTPVNGVPSTLNQGDEYEVVYTANAGYAFEFGAITSASGTAGTEDITITISDAVQAVAQVEGGARYATLAEAVGAAVAGDTVTVLANCTVATAIKFNYGITVSNDYTVTLSAAYALRLANGTSSPVTFCGSGSFVQPSGTSGSPVLVGNNENKSTYGESETFSGSLVLNSGTIGIDHASNNGVKVEYGTFTMNGGTVYGGSRCIKADSDNGNFTSTVTINGGVITASSGKTAIGASQEGTGVSTVVVNGGDITGTIVGTGMVTIPGTSTARFSADQTAFCEAGYATTLNAGWYTVGLASYTITYKYGENALTGLTPAAYTIEDAVTLPSEVNLGVTGVAFEAWTNELGQTVASWAAGAKTGDQTFYAQVTAVVPTKYEPGEAGITPPAGKTAAEFATDINNNKATYINTPSTSDVADTTAYLALFQAVADTEKGTVSIGLTTEAAADAKDAADDTAADIVSDLTATTVTIDAEPGLWYSISVSSTLSGLAAGEGTRVMATDSSLSEGKLTLNIPVIDDSTPARFYKVNVNVADKQTP